MVYNNEIHILGSPYGTATRKSHYKYNGSAWESVSTLPYDFYRGSAVVFNNEIHILGGGSNYYTDHYKFNGTSWESVSTLLYEFYNGSAVVYNNEIHILGGGASDNRTNHYKYNGSAWESVSTLLYEFYLGSAVVYNNEIHILGSGTSDNQTNHYNIKDDIRHISAMLPKGTHIMISDDEDIYYTANATKIASNIAEAAETGFVELLATLSETPKGYLTFY